MYYDFVQQYFLELSLSIGLIIGSFINVVAYRYPLMIKLYWNEPAYMYCGASSINKKKLSLSYPDSHCPHCGKKISWYDNIPVISWIILWGVCRHCDQKINIRYPFIELITALCFFLCALLIGDFMWAIAVMICSTLLITASLIDFDNQWLPDILTHSILWLGVIFAWADISTLSLHDSITGVIAGFFSFWILHYSAREFFAKESLGWGDVILFAGLGGWVGPVALIYVALISSLCGIIYIIIFSKPKEKVAFGPWLSLAGWIMIILGDNRTSFFEDPIDFLYHY